MRWEASFTQLGPPPSAASLAELCGLAGQAKELLSFYSMHDGGVIDRSVAYARLFPIREIVETRMDGNAGWPDQFLFVGGNGGGEAFGVLLDECVEHYFSTQWIASPKDLTLLGTFGTFVSRLRSGVFI